MGTFLQAHTPSLGAQQLSELYCDSKQNTASVNRRLQFGWNCFTETRGTGDTCYTPALTDRAVPLPGSKEPSCFLETNLKEKVISDRNCYLMASFKKVEKRKAAISSIISVFQLSSLQ
jgi:hypothetical protein